MRELAIKVNIVGKEYTIKVDAKNEKNLRKAADLLARYVREKKEQLNIHDKQDLLAIVAFDCVFEELLCESDKMEINQRLERLTNLFDVKPDIISDSE